MKKIVLLIMCMMFLSGCSATNGIVSKSDVETLNYNNVKLMVAEQKNVSYIPDDVKEFLSSVEEANKNNNESAYGYLDIRSSIIGYGNDGNSEFLHEVYTSDDLNEEERVEFNKLVDILDQTISKGIKSYLDQNINENLESVRYNKVGRVWMFINPVDAYMEPENEDRGNSVTLMIKVKDIKDKEYKKIVDNIGDDELILNSINIGKQQNFIELSNMEQKNSISYGVIKPAVSYQLFMEEKEINKVRLSVESVSNEKINDDFKSLSNISNQLGFTIEDMKQLEEVRTLIKENKPGKKTLSSDRFNFSFRNLENKNSRYGPYDSTNLTEVIIEKK